MASSAELIAVDDELTFGADRFGCHPECRRSGDLLQRIEYRKGETGAEIGGHVFWGPYLEIGPGVYLFRLDGRIEGELTLEFAYDKASKRLKTVILADLAQPTCVVLTSPARDLEIRAVNTAALRALSLNSVSVRCAYRATSSA